MSESRVFTADWVLPIAAPPFRDGAVRVVDGRIAAVGSRDDVLAAGEACDERVELRGAALLPGLVNTHAHLELTALRGALEERDFFAWIRRLTRTKYERMSEDDILASARQGVLEATRAGITTIADIADIGVSVQALVEAGLRAVVYQEVFGPDPAQADDSLRQLDDKLAALRLSADTAAGRVGVVVAPPAPDTVSARRFGLGAAYALEGASPVSIHAAESDAERSFVRDGRGAFAEFLRGRGIEWTPPRGSTIEYLEALGALESRPLLAHCVDVSEGDLARVAAAGGSIAHCPKANAKLGHGIAPLAAMLQRGVRTGLGTDSVASNNTCDLIDEARFAALAARVRGGRPSAPADDAASRVESPAGPTEPTEPTEPTASDALRLATLGGAEALGLDDEIGSLEIGKRADLTAIDLSGPWAQPVHDVETAIVFSASGRDVALTVVDGEILYRDGEYLRLDPAGIRTELEASVRRWGR